MGEQIKDDNIELNMYISDDINSLNSSISDNTNKSAIYSNSLAEKNDMNEGLKQEIERLNKQIEFERLKNNTELEKLKNEFEDKNNRTIEQLNKRYVNIIENKNKIIADQGRELEKMNIESEPIINDNDTEIVIKKNEVKMSSQSYKYDEKFDSNSKEFTVIIPPSDDDSFMNDLSNNIIDNNNLKKTYKKFTFKEIEEKIIDNYFDDKTSYSSALDIIATYLRGQKLIYMESKSYCENKLNRLMMPAIFLSTSATVLSGIVKEFYWGAYLIAGVNGIIAFLLAVVSYLKLDAASEAHKITAHQYDKLQTKIEFLSGQTLLFDSKKDHIEQELKDVKKKIEEIKETNQFIVPKKIRTLYPIMFNTNVFLIIKKIDDITKKKINKIKDLKNERNYLIEVLNSKVAACKDEKTSSKIKSRIGERIKECENEKKRHEENIVVLKSAFSVIDEMCMKEMENAEKYNSMTLRRWFLCGFGVKDIIKDPRELNKFIQDIMNPYKDKIDEDVSSVKNNDSDINQLVNELAQTKKILKNKRLDELKKRKKAIKELKKANGLLKENIGITKQFYDKMEIYDKLERGEYEKEQTLKLNRPKRIVRLFGIGGNEEDNFKLHSDEEKCSLSGSENSDPYADYDVRKKDTEN